MQRGDGAKIIPKPNSASAMASMVITCQKMISVDSYDKGLGKFAAALLKENNLFVVKILPLIFDSF